MTSEEAFLKAIEKDPDLLARLQKRTELEEFYSKYNVNKATPLKCPACAAVLQSPGSLYYNPNVIGRFVCRKCHLIFSITCHTIDIEDLIENMRLVVKGDEKATLDWYRRIENSEDS